jgi:hypothetical protein
MTQIDRDQHRDTTRSAGQVLRQHGGRLKICSSGGVLEFAAWWLPAAYRS